jgi:hypothetical protein
MRRFARKCDHDSHRATLGRRSQHAVGVRRQEITPLIEGRRATGRGTFHVTGAEPAESVQDRVECREGMRFRAPE